ncbi:MAG: histidine--tRNA ligase [Chitinivibrionales bacterium]|nr:histidine--tRNA ligase [Chitinivibrionales bacterium]
MVIPYGIEKNPEFTKRCIMAVLSAPKGTRDFYPEDMALRRHIFCSWRRTCRRYGFEEFDAPLFEHLELYTRKSGDEIERQLYTFTDKGGRDMALRPEMTPSLARMAAAKGQALKRPVRWFSIPRLFRYEKMQRGRLREFFQLNMDILGVAEKTADADLIAAVVGMMTDLGLESQDFSVLISSRDLLEQLFRSVGVPAERLGAVYQTLDKKYKVAPEVFEKMLVDSVGDSVRAARLRKILSAETLDQAVAEAPDVPAAEDLRTLLDLLDSYGMRDYVRFDIGIVRGLAYYTGIVFEVFDKQRSLRAVAGGGRYDRLVALYGGADTPAVGFAAGDVVLGELLKNKGIVPLLEPRSTTFVVSVDKDVTLAVEITQLLRNAGVSAEYSLRQVAVGKQLKQANAARCTFVVFAGGEEEGSGRVKLKDMRSGEERVTDVANLARTIGELE